MTSYPVPNPSYTPAPNSVQPTVSIPGTAIDDIIGGAALFGKKTIIGIVGAVAITFADKLQVAPHILTPDIVEMTLAFFLGMAGLGYVSKTERLTRAVISKQAPMAEPVIRPNVSQQVIPHAQSGGLSQ